jgi:hypothetical protein
MQNLEAMDITEGEPIWVKVREIQAVVAEVPT